jgi:hypothetical protein
MILFELTTNKDKGIIMWGSCLFDINIIKALNGDNF